MKIIFHQTLRKATQMYTIKKIEWEKWDSKEDGLLMRWDAIVPLENIYSIFLYTNGNYWLNGNNTNYDTIEEAQTAAQEIFEKGILQYLNVQKQEKLK